MATAKGSTLAKRAGSAPPKSRVPSKSARAAVAVDAPASTAPDTSLVVSETVGDPVPRPGKLSRRPPLALSGKKVPVKPLAGSVQIHGDSWTLRVRIDGRQQRIKLGKVAEMSEARAEEKGAAWRERMARERRGAAPSKLTCGSTFRDIARRWTSGELARDFPDHVKAKRTAERDVQRLERYVYPIAGHLPIVDFTIDHAEAVMKALPPKRVRTPATRRHVAQLMHRILGIAVFPLRLIKMNPLPKGFMPKVGPSKAKGYLYPEDDARLLGCVDVPLEWRFWCGFLNREGPRTSEAESFTWADFDLERGAVKLDENKTDDPRAWALSRGVVAGLRAMRARRTVAGAPVGPDDPVFILRTDGKKYDAAKLFREHLRIAGIDRPELFERSASRMHIRRHDLRATFVTLNLAAGRTETWIADRTGHTSSDMINKYRRAARTAGELDLGELAPLDAAIPELAQAPGTNGGSGPTRSGDPADASVTESAACAQGCAHAGLDVADRGVDPPETREDSDVSPPSGASLNPLIMVRIHAPEPQSSLSRLPSSGLAAGLSALRSRRGARCHSVLDAAGGRRRSERRIISRWSGASSSTELVGGTDDAAGETADDFEYRVLPLFRAGKSCYDLKVMATPDAKPFQVAQKIEAGVSFEVWRTPQGALRLDWNRQGIVLETLFGHGSHEFATVVTRRWEAVRRSGLQVLIIADFWEMPNYDSAFRAIHQEWALKNRSSFVQPLHILTRSKLVSMGTAVTNLALGGIITTYTQRPQFDLVVKKSGFTPNPQMPFLSDP